RRGGGHDSERAAGAVGVVMTARRGTGDRGSAAVDRQPRIEDRVDAVLEISKGELLPSHASRIRDERRVAERIASAPSPAARQGEAAAQGGQAAPPSLPASQSIQMQQSHAPQQPPWIQLKIVV